MQDLGVQEQIQPASPVVVPPGFAVGAIVKWKTSLAEWVVLSIDEATAKIKQIRGWASNLVFEANLSELRWSDQL